MSESKNEMKVNKNQAIYKYLPGTWAINSDTYSSMLVTKWNTVPVSELFSDKIVNEIMRNINFFANRGGDIEEFGVIKDCNFVLLEAAKNKNIADIYAEINPKLFYCPKCGEIKTVNYQGLTNAYCKKDKHKLKQLQFVYACECGFAEGIRAPYREGTIFYYMPESGKKGDNTYKFIYYEGKNKKYLDTLRKCSSCGNYLRVRNSGDRSLFNPFEIKAVNLINKEMGEFLKKGEKADKLLISNWLGLFSDNDLKKVINNPEELVENSNDEEKIMELVKKFNLKYEVASAAYYSSNSNKVENNLDKIILDVNTYIDDISTDNVDMISTELIEYYTLKNNDKIIDIETVKKRSKLVESIRKEEEIDLINKKCGINNSILSYDIEIVNAAYGYTRIVSDPNNISESYRKNGNRLKLKSFYDDNKYKVYTSILNTEGVLIDFDRKRILQWLIDNDIVKNDIDLENETIVKQWFLNNVDLSEITPFSDIEIRTNKQLITKCVYTLIHTISHLLIKSAGIYSGLNKDSIAEIIFPSIPSIYLYSTTVQGITMGALSGMYEENYKAFIETAMSEHENCMFDPICMDVQNGACVACSLLNETSCTHFNKDISRKMLYGGEFMLDNDYKITIKKGFWN